MEPPTALSVLIVGCGNIAGGLDADNAEWVNKPQTHAGAYTAHGGFTLLACVEPDPGRRADFAERWGVGHAYATLDEAFADGHHFDVVSICSSTGSHASDLRQVLDLHPRVVFCEKPLTNDLALSRDIVSEYENTSTKLVVNYSRHWDTRVSELAEQLSSGLWGKIRAVTGVYTKGLLNNGSHLLDLLLMLFRDIRVVAAGPSRFDMWEEDATVPAMLVADVDIPVTINCGHAHDFTLFELEVITERGVIAMRDSGNSWETRLPTPSTIHTGYTVLGKPTTSPGTLTYAFAGAIAEIYDLSQTDAAGSCTGTDALAVQSLCQSIRDLSELHG